MFLFVSLGSEMTGEHQDEGVAWHSTSSMSLLFSWTSL